MTTTTRPRTTGSDGLPADRPRFILGLSRPNLYGGNCRVCGTWVPPNGGHRVRLRGGRWAVQHVSLAACQDAYATRAEPVSADTEDRYRPERGDVHAIAARVWAHQVIPARGIVEGALGERWVFVRVSINRYTGRPYLTRWDGARWVYDRLPASALGRETLAGAGHAAAFGAAFSRCVFCGRTLDTPESVSAGYGPTCAAQRGLAWGGRPVAERVRGGSDSVAALRAAGAALADGPAVVEDGGTCVRCGEEFPTAREALQGEHPCL